MGRVCFCPGCDVSYYSGGKMRCTKGKSNCSCPICKKDYIFDKAHKITLKRKKVSLFRPPKDPYYFELWKKAIPRADRSLGPQDVVCDKHFKKEDILSYFETKLPDGKVFHLMRSRIQLKPDAVPCIFPNVPGHSTFEGNNLTKPNKNSKKIKIVPQKKYKSVKISCSDIAANGIANSPNQSKKADSSIQSKKNDSSNQSKKNDSSGQAGKENILLEVIVVHPIPEKPSTSQSSFLKEKQNLENEANSLLSDSQNHVISEPELPASVCPFPARDGTAENHSNKKIVTESPTPDNLTENYSKQCSSVRTIPELSELDALPGNCSDQNVCDMTLTDSPTHDDPSGNYSDLSDCDKTLSELENHCDQSIHGIGVTESNNILSESVLKKQVSFDFLKANVSLFETNNSWWRVNTFDDFIAFTRWTSNYTTERKIVITKKLAVKVFLKDKETTIGSDLKEFSIFDITKLIYRVESLKFCTGIDNKEGNCAGFTENTVMGKRLNFCLNCLNWRNEEKKRTLQRLKNSANCVELLKFNLIS